MRKSRALMCVCARQRERKRGTRGGHISHNPFLELTQTVQRVLPTLEAGLSGSIAVTSCRVSLWPSDCVSFPLCRQSCGPGALQADSGVKKQFGVRPSAPTSQHGQPPPLRDDWPAHRNEEEAAADQRCCITQAYVPLSLRMCEFSGCWRGGACSKK